MVKFVTFIFLLILVCPISSYSEQNLFILSGQSNMALLDPDITFIPIIKRHYGKSNTIFVHDAMGSQPISGWDEGGLMWITLTDKIKKVVKDKQLSSVTFIWMQGEADRQDASIYEYKLLDLFTRVAALFPNVKISYVVGRINDCAMHMYNPEWVKIREIQERVCAENANYVMVNTDDLNGENNDIHMFGFYDILSERFAKAAIKLTKKRFP